MTLDIGSEVILLDFSSPVKRLKITGETAKRWKLSNDRLARKEDLRILGESYFSIAVPTPELLEELEKHEAKVAADRHLARAKSRLSDHISKLQRGYFQNQTLEQLEEILATCDRVLGDKKSEER
jgi:hypothetical protein